MKPSGSRRPSPPAKAVSQCPRTPRRRTLLQLWLADRAWGRILLYLWLLLFRHGKWAVARGGIGRGLRDLRSQIIPRVLKKNDPKP